MTSHELAKQLLEGPDKPVVLAVACGKDTVSSCDNDENPVDDIAIVETENTVTVRAYVFDTKFGYDD